MLDKSKKFTVGDKEYSFKMTNRTILKVDELYGNYGVVIEGIMVGNKFYTNSLRLLACSCMEKEWELEELTDTLTPEQMKLLPEFVVKLYFSYMGVELEKTDNEEVENKTEKN